MHKRWLLLLLMTTAFNAADAQIWSLQQCMDTAQVHNKNLKIGRNMIAAGGYKTKEAKSMLMPRITANAEYRYYAALPYQLLPLSTFSPTAPDGQFKEAQFGVPHNLNASLQLNMPLYNPQVYGAIQTAQIASELSELQYHKTAEQVFFDISNLYYNAQILQHQLAFSDSNLLNAERLLYNTKLLHEQLLARTSDVARLNLQVSQMRVQKEKINNQYEQVLNGLKFAMGISLEQNLQIDPQILRPFNPDYKSNASSDMRIEETRKRLLSSELTTLNRSRYLPALNLFGTYGTNGFGYDKQPDPFLKFFPLGFAGVQLSYPLFNGTQTNHKMAQKQFEIQNSELQLELLTEQNAMLLENALQQRLLSERAIETASEQIGLAQTIYAQTLIQQKQGIANLSDVLLADNALRTAQQNYLSSVIDYLKADLELKKISGNINVNKP